LNSAAENVRVLAEISVINSRLEQNMNEFKEAARVANDTIDPNKEPDFENDKHLTILVELVGEGNALEHKLNTLLSTLNHQVESSQNSHNQMVTQIKDDLEFVRFSDSFEKSFITTTEFLEAKFVQVYGKYSGRKFHYSKAYEDACILSDEATVRAGDAFELFLGRHYEKKGFPVLFNGIVKRKKDQGVDLIIFCNQSNTAKYIQVKNWYQRSFDLAELDNVYKKLTATPATYIEIELQIQHMLTSFKDSATVNFKSLINELPNMTIEKLLYLPNENNITDEVARFFEKGVYKDMKLRFHNQKFKNFFGVIYK
jgi:hypothetical protein